VTPQPKLCPLARVLRLLYFLSLLLFALACEQSANWRAHSSSEGQFSAEFPATVHSRTIRAESTYGSLEVALVTSEWEKKAFAVIYVDYPAAALTSEVEVFDHALLDATSDLGAKVMRHFETKLHGHPGRGYELRFGRDRIALGRFYLVGRRLYHLQVALPQAEESSEEVTRFLKSFQVQTR
jgi:hypothetical protein